MIHHVYIYISIYNIMLYIHTYANMLYMYIMYIMYIYIYIDHLLKGPQGRSPTCINKSINLRFLRQGTLMNLFGCASPPPGHRKRYSSHPPRLTGKIIQESGNYHFFLGLGGPQIVSSNQIGLWRAKLDEVSG